MKIEILGVKIDGISKEEIAWCIRDYLSSNHAHLIVTLNPEFIMTAQNDLEFKKILNSADLSVVDGIGLKFAAWLGGYNLPRITGVELTRDLLKKAEEEKLKVAVYNCKKGLSSQRDIEEAFIKNYPELQFFIKDIERGEERLGEEFQKFLPQIVFVTLGAPWQEKFIDYNIKNMSSVRLAIGIGGTFDFLTGKLKRAPKWMQKIGLEWLFRLIVQPWRIKRIITATIKFSIAVIKSK